MSTALDIISSSLRLINVLAASEQPSLDLSNDSLTVLNQMIDAWNTDRLAIFTTQSNDFPFVLNQQAYTLGTGGNFNMTRPARIDAMSSILLFNAANPVEVPLSLFSIDDWQTKVPVKSVSGSFPLICYDDGGFPLRTLNFWPIPTTANNVRIYSWAPLAAQTLAAQLSFPPGYAEAIRYNLAVRLSGEFQAPLMPSVSAIAAESLARIKTMNAPDLEIQSDLVPSPAGYNYKADLFGIGL